MREAVEQGKVHGKGSKREERTTGGREERMKYWIGAEGGTKEKGKEKKKNERKSWSGKINGTREAEERKE